MDSDTKVSRPMLPNCKVYDAVISVKISLNNWYSMCKKKNHLDPFY